MRPSIRLMVGMMCVLLIAVAVVPRISAADLPVSALEYAGRLGGSAQAVAVDNGFAYTGGTKSIDSVFTVFSLSNPTQPVPVGTLDLPGTVTQIKARGTIVYVASDKGLHVVNVTDSAHPALVGTITNAGLTINDLQVLGTTLYVASSNGLIIYNISNPAAPAPIGGYSSDGASVWVEGSRAYFGSKISGLQILDISNPAQPVYLGSFAMSGTASDIVVTGSTMYVAGGFGLLKADVSNPAQPVQLAQFNESVNMSAYGAGLELVGSRLYVTDRYWGVLIFDVAPGASLPLAGTYRSSGEGLGLAVAGPLVYIADGAIGMTIIDTSAMHSAVVIGSLSTNRGVAAQQRVGNLLYTLQNYFINPTTERGSLVIYDVSNPQAPVRVKDLQFTKPAISLKVVGTKVYVASIADGLKIVDVANPAAAAVVGSIAAPEPFAFSDIDVVNGMAVVTSGSLVVYDVNNPAQPQLRGLLSSQGGTAVKVVGGTAYVAGGNGDLRIIDISNPAAPALRSTLHVGGGSQDVDVAGSTAYVTVPGEGLAIVDVQQPAAPRLITIFEVIGESYDVRVENQRVYVTGAYHGLTVLDAQNPQAPRLLAMIKDLGNTSKFEVLNGIVYIMFQAGSMLFLDTNVVKAPVLRGVYSTLNPAWDVAFVNSTIAYVAAGPGGLQIIDTTAPRQPRVVGAYDARSNAPYGGPRDTVQVEIAGNRAYVLDARNGFDVLDISNPLRPVRLGRTDWFYADAMEVEGSLVYGMSWTQEMRIIDVSNPAAPTLRYFSAPVFTIDAVGSIAYMGNHQGFKIYNMTNPASPQLLGTYVDPNSACTPNAITVTGQIAYVGTSGCGLMVLDVSNPATPTKIGTFATTSPMRDFALIGTTLYIAHWGRGVLVLDVSEPTMPRELARYTDIVNNSQAIEVRGDYLYVAEGTGGLYFLRYSHPTLARVGAAGGTLTSAADTTTYQFAAGTFAETAVLIHTPIVSRPTSGDLYNIGHTFNITGTLNTSDLGIQPSAPFTVTIQYSDSQKGGALENTLGLYAWDGSQWVAEPSSVLDAAANRIVATPDHFGLFAVLGETNHVYLPVVRR